MLLVIALAPFVVLATRVVADPKAVRASSLDPSLSLPFIKHLHTNDAATIHPSKQDRSRFKSLRKGSQKGSKKCSAPTSAPTGDSTPEVAVVNTAFSYVTTVGVGVPPTFYNLIVDTGSSNTWVGANSTYKMTNTSVKTPNRVNVTYGSGNFIGDLYNDTVTLAPGLAISQQPIGVASNSSGIAPLDGILGLGLRNLTYGSLLPDNRSTIPTVTDLLFEQKTIKQNLVAISFAPVPSGPATAINGELTFGATDPTKYTGDIKYSSLTESGPAAKWWGIDSSVQYGGANGSASVNILSTSSGFVDTGSTLIYLASDAYQRYVKATGAVMNETIGSLYITQAQYKKLQPLVFNIGGSSFELIPNAQIWPRALNTLVGGSEDLIYLVIQDLADLLPGVNFVCGMAFLERYYSVFDTEHRQLGLATTAFTNAETN